MELILSLAALSKGLYDVVAMSLVGSVLSNLLLVLGAQPGWQHCCTFTTSSLRMQAEHSWCLQTCPHSYRRNWMLISVRACCAGCCFLVGGTQYHEQSFNAGFNKVMS